MQIKICALVFYMFIACDGFTQFRVGIRGSAVSSSVLYSPQVQVDEAQAVHADIQKPVNTYHYGFVFQFKAGKTFVIRPAIEYFKKGWRVYENDRARINTNRLLRQYNIDYLQIPLNVLLTSSLANGKIYIGLGPYISYAFNGNVRVNNEIFDLEFKKFDEPVFTYLPGDNYKTVQFVSHYSINRFDFGGNGVIGYEFNNGLFIEAGVDIGLQQVSTSYERYNLQWNRTIRDPAASVKYSSIQLIAGWMINFTSHHSKIKTSR